LGGLRAGRRGVPGEGSCAKRSGARAWLGGQRTQAFFRVTPPRVIEWSSRSSAAVSSVAFRGSPAASSCVYPLTRSQDSARVRPVEGSGEGMVPMAAELVDRTVERLKAVEGAVAKRLAREDAEPDLDLIEPAAVLWGEREPNPRMPSQPFLRTLPVRVLMLSVTMMRGPRRTRRTSCSRNESTQGIDRSGMHQRDLLPDAGNDAGGRPDRFPSFRPS
jgi:hypothetical protein